MSDIQSRGVRMLGDCGGKRDGGGGGGEFWMIKKEAEQLKELVVVVGELWEMPERWEKEWGKRKEKLKKGCKGIERYMQSYTGVFLFVYSQTSIKWPLKGNVKSGLLTRWSLKKGLGVWVRLWKKQRISNNDQVSLRLLCLAAFVEISSLIF